MTSIILIKYQYKKGPFTISKDNQLMKMKNGDTWCKMGYTEEGDVRFYNDSQGNWWEKELFNRQCPYDTPLKFDISSLEFDAVSNFRITFELKNFIPDFERIYKHYMDNKLTNQSRRLFHILIVRDGKKMAMISNVNYRSVGVNGKVIVTCSEIVTYESNYISNTRLGV